MYERGNAQKPNVRTDNSQYLLCPIVSVKAMPKNISLLNRYCQFDGIPQSPKVSAHGIVVLTSLVEVKKKKKKLIHQRMCDINLGNGRVKLTGENFALLNKV